jgi:mRNA interferase RelE/StbE
MIVLLYKAASKYLERLGEPMKGRFTTALKDLAKNPPAGDIRPVVGQAGYFRLKVGDFRALYRIENDTIFVTHIDLRGQAYKKKNRRKK